jgi:hypothetical protein
MFGDHVKSREVTTNATTYVTPAITHSMLALCSAACKALRYASTALTRGLRALTPPARSSSIDNYVMAGRVKPKKIDRMGIDLISMRRYSDGIVSVRY